VQNAAPGGTTRSPDATGERGSSLLRQLWGTPLTTETALVYLQADTRGSRGGWEAAGGIIAGVLARVMAGVFDPGLLGTT
jgi:hypothetical protein